MLGTHHFILIIISVLIAIISSYTALTLAERITDKHRSHKNIWILSASFNMGVGIFATHFIAMSAMHVTIPIKYDPILLFCAFCLAVVASYTTFYILYVPSMPKIILCGSIIMTGAGITLFHYMAIIAIQAPLKIQFLSLPFILSIIFALFFSSIGLGTFFHIKRTLKTTLNRKLYASFILGLSIILMHYTGMESIVYLPHSHLEKANGINTYLLAIIVALCTILIMCFALIFAIYDYQTLYRERRLRGQVKETEDRYKSLFEHNPDGIYSLDRNGALTNINKALEKMLGYSEEEFSTMTFHHVIEKSYLQATEAYFQLAIKGIPQYYETVANHKNGEIVPLHITNMPIIVEGEIIGVYGVAKNITKEKEATRLLEENNEKYHSLLDHNLDAVFEIDLMGVCKSVNKKAEELTLYSKAELLKMIYPANPIFISSQEKIPEFYSHVISRKSFHMEQKILNKLQQELIVDISVVPIEKQGEIDGVFIIVRDITEKKQIQQQMKKLAYTDQLTGLPNRHSFYIDLTEVIKNADKKKEKVAILAIDFDNFKYVNDQLGHQSGDKYLRKVAERMKSCLREQDLIARIGGDEFIIVLQDTSELVASNVAQQLLVTMNQPMTIRNHEIIVTLSIGISFYTHYTNNIEELIRQADIALYSAKENGKNNYQFFTKNLDLPIQRKQKIENALRVAIKYNEFTLFYQPQIEIQTGRVVGLEALLRWHPDFGEVKPAEFIPIAEETGLIIPIGEWVLLETCRQIKKWKQAGFNKIKVSFNVSARQFKDKDFFLKIKNRLLIEKVDPADLEIEITESVMLDLDEALPIIEELKKLGLKIAIDDFGAGYSSLNVLKKVEIDTLKIDKALIDDVIYSKRHRTILTAIINVGNKLEGTDVIVEGIDSKEQVDFLKAFSVIGQGYYYSHPLPPEQLEKEWLHIKGGNK